MRGEEDGAPPGGRVTGQACSRAAMAAPAEQDLTLAEADSSKDKSQVFGILRLQEESKCGGEKATSSTGAGSSSSSRTDGRWQAPIFALARKASETLSSGIHVLPKVTEPKICPFSEEWSVKGEFSETYMRKNGTRKHPILYTAHAVCVLYLHLAI